ncbi:MAG: hypothetical protein JXR43_13070 [Burkholderiaceae bacterium]|nr:hypothetical protein [Burkholderiaceae bacterium]
MQTTQPRSRPTHKLLPIAAALALSLSACGGGGGGTAQINPAAATNTTLKGAVIDAPIANAAVTFTSGAPMGQPGSVVVGTATADASGNYTVQAALPNTAVPLFANATSPDGQVVLTAYLGTSSAVLAAGSLTSANLPNLIISQVTTAALAVYVAAGGSYASLTPTLYAALLSQHHDDILALSAAIKAVADGYCARPAHYDDTEAMAHDIARQGLASPTSSALNSASTTLGSSCDSNLKALMQYISSDERWAPELDLGDVLEQGAPVVAVGTYTLQGVLAQSGMSALPMQPAPPASTASATSVPQPAGTLPPGILNMAVQVDANGNVSSSDGSGNVTGVIVGNLITLTVKDGQGNTYVLAGKAGLLPSGFVIGSSASAPAPSAPASSASSTTNAPGTAIGYGLRMGGRTQSGGMLTRFDAVLVPQNSQPGWAQIAPTKSEHSDGVTCSKGFGLRLMGTGATVGGLVLGACVTPQAAGLNLSPAQSNGSGDEYGDDDFKPGSSVSFSGLDLSSSQGSATPYIISAPTVTISKTLQAPTTGACPSGSMSSNTQPGTCGTTLTGQMFYVMGAKDMIFSTAKPTSNGLFVMNENPLDHLQENQAHQDH